VRTTKVRLRTSHPERTGREARPTRKRVSRTSSRWRSWPGRRTTRCQTLARRHRTSRRLRSGGIASWRTLGPAGKPWLPVVQRRLSEGRENCCGSSAYAVSGWSRHRRRTRSGSMGRTRCGKLANGCSITAASNAQGVMRRTAVGRTGHDDPRSFVEYRE
jgi:hypothetical protein